MPGFDYKKDSIEGFNSPFLNNEDDNIIKSKDIKGLNPNKLMNEQILLSDENASLPAKELENSSQDLQKAANKVTETTIHNFQSKIVQYNKGEQRTRDLIPTEKQPLGKGNVGSVHQHRVYAGRAVKKSDETLEHEYEIGNKLDHPNIVKVHQLHIKSYPEQNLEDGRIQKKSKMTMDKIEGKTLDSIVKNQQKISPSEAQNLLSQAQNCCLYLLDQHIAWADLNPGNIFIANPEQRLVIADFAYWKEVKDMKTGAKELLLGSMELAKNIVKSLSAFYNENIDEAVLKIILPEEFLKIDAFIPPYLNLNLISINSECHPWMKPILDKIDNLPEEEIPNFLNSYFDHVIKALEGALPKDLAKASLATSILGLANERAAKLKTESEAVPSEAGALQQCIEQYFPGIESLPNYSDLLRNIISKVDYERSPDSFTLKNLMQIVSETIGREYDTGTLYMFRSDMEKARGLL